MARKILIADDDPVIIELLNVNLEMEGYDVLVASNGRQAVELAESESPEVVILDVMMPEMDGWAACEALAGIPSTRAIPVIFLSARAQRTDLERGRELGAQAYLTKPFDPTELLTVIEKILEGTYQPWGSN